MKIMHSGDGDVGRDFSDPLLKHIRVGKNQEVLRALEKIDPCQWIDRSNATLLHVAAEYGNLWLVRHLIDLGANVDAPDNSQETPLMFAVKNRQLEAVKMLLDANADIYVPDASGECALAKAFNLSRNITKVLLERVTVESLNNSVHVEEPAFHIYCPIDRFIPLKNVEVTKILLAKSSSVNEPLFLALHLAVHQLDVENVKLLLAHAAENKLTYSFNTLSHLLLEYRGQDKVLEMIDVLLTGGVNLIDRDRQIIFAKILLEYGDKEVIRRILKHGLDLNFIDKFGRTALHYLAQNRDPDVFDELRDVDFDVHATTAPLELSLLHYAAATGNPSSIRFLLDRGADVDVTNHYNNTPLVRLFYTDCKFDDHLDSYVECVEILLARGANPRVRPITFEIFENLRFELLLPILLHLAAIEASGRGIDPETIDTVQSNPRVKEVFCSKKAELEEMKKIKLGISVTLLDVLAANDREISLYARHRSCAVALFGEVKKDSWDPCYQRKLEVSLLRLTKLVNLREKTATVISELFDEYYNTSVHIVAQKIVEYLQDHELPKIL